MTGLWIPILLAIIGLITAIVAYRGVQRGGSRFYQLERDALLRQASFYQLASIVLFVGAVGLLVYNQNIQATEPAEADGVDSAEVSATATPSPETVLQSQPPTLAVEPTATEDPAAPTLTPTSIIRRAEVKNTGGSGAYLRDGASTLAEELDVLDEGTLLTLLDEEPVEAEGYSWIHVRTLGGIEGYVADLYLEEFQR